MRTACAARRATVPPTTALRLPPVPAPKGAAAVSPWMSTTSSMSTPRWSATTWIIVVSRLWPWLPEPINTCTVPSGSTRTVATSEPITPYARPPRST